MKGRPAREEWNGITIFRPESLGAANGAADKILFQSLFRSPAWTKAIREVIAEFRPDVLHVHDIWLANSVVAARRSERMIMDLHENMPAAVVEYLKGFRGAKKAFNWMFKRRGRVLAHERRALASTLLPKERVVSVGTVYRNVVLNTLLTVDADLVAIRPLHDRDTRREQCKPRKVATVDRKIFNGPLVYLG